jgi:hypothetical protein
MTVTAVAAADEPGRPRSPRDFCDDLAALAKAQGVQPSPDPFAYLDGWIEVEDCVGPAFSAAPFQAEVN